MRRKLKIFSFVVAILISLVAVSYFAPQASAQSTSTNSPVQAVVQLPGQFIASLRQLILSLQGILGQQAPVSVGQFPPLTSRFSLGGGGPHVLQLQEMLSYDGVFFASTTGVYDIPTIFSVQRFQSKYNILKAGSPFVNGFGLAGPLTRAKLNQLYASSGGSGGSVANTTQATTTTSTFIASAPQLKSGKRSPSGGGPGPSVTITPSGYQVNASSGSGGSISPSSVLVAHGASQAFTITPDVGYQVNTLTVDGKTVTPSTSYTLTNVTAPHQINVTFAVKIPLALPQPPFSLLTTVSPLGSGSVSKNPNLNSYAQDSAVSLSANPATGYQFQSWSGDVSSTQNPTTVTMNTDKEVTANFTQRSFSISASAGAGGSISPSGTVSVSYGGTRTFTITPNAGYTISQVLVDGSSVALAGTYSFQQVVANHTIAVSFTPAVVAPTPPPSDPGTPNAGTTCTSITNLTITWTFDKAYPCGQFVTGSSWWVVGPVTVTSVSPEWNGSTNGSMVDPVATGSGSWQGYDNRKGGYLDSFRVRFPLTLTPSGKAVSLVSTVGLATPATGGAAEVLDKAAVLTVLPSAPSANAFRPPYVAGSKPIYTTDQINYSLLPNLAIPAGTAVPDYVGTNKIFHVWLDHGPKVDGARIHPRTNMPPYPRDSAQQVSVAALLALSNSSQKTVMTNRLVQLGIDSYAISLTNGDAFRAYGGFASGRKWPILFAGIMLNDAGMKNPAKKIWSGSNIDKFGEDGHTYYGAPTVDYPNGKPLWGRDCGSNPQYYKNHDCRDPEGILNVAALPMGGSYEGCCTSKTWVGEVLAASLMGAKDLWNHPALFDYMDRWIATPSMWSSSGLIYGYGDLFVEAMWRAYRPTVGAVSPPPVPTPVSYSLTLSSSNGSITKTPDQTSYTSGASVTLTAVPAAGYEFASWSGDLSGVINPTSITLDANKTVSALFTPIVQAPPPSATDVTNGIIARWVFDQASITGNSAIDVTGNGYNATMSNTTVVSGKVNEALSFNGSTSYVNAGSPAALDDLHNKGGMTLSAWIKPSKLNSGIILAKSCLPGEGSCWAFYLSDTSKLTFFRHTAASSLTKVASTALTTGAWQHVAVTWTGVSGSSNIKLYINGVETAYSSSSGSGALSSDSSWSLYMGRTHTGKYPFSGLMDDVRIYGRPLTAVEVGQVYAATNVSARARFQVANIFSLFGDALQFLYTRSFTK